MARVDNLTNFLTDVSTSIKNKIGDNTPISANEFDTKIDDIDDLNSIVTDDNLSNFTPVTTSTQPFQNSSTAQRSLFYIILKEIPKLTIDFTSYTSLNFACLCLYNLKNIDVSGWDISTIGKFRGTFYGCRSLEEIDFSACNIPTSTTSGKTLSLMFKGCNSLKRADLSCFKGIWDSLGELFNGCTSLEHIDIRGIDLTSQDRYFNTFLGKPSGTPAWENGLVPYDCEIIVGTQADKDYMTTYFASYTNVKTVAEYEAS